MTDLHLLAQIRHLQSELAQRTRERDQARANFRKAFGIVQGVYTATGVRTFVVLGKVHEWEDEAPEVTLRRLRSLLRGIPMGVQRMHEASPDVPRPKWHPTVLATEPMPLEVSPRRYYAETEPAPIYPVTLPASL